jgi:hypothetical protein
MSSPRANSLFKMAAEHGRHERSGESYSGPYVELLSDARTPLDSLFACPVSWARGMITLTGVGNGGSQDTTTLRFEVPRQTRTRFPVPYVDRISH